jgi:predicted MFS family arabinose efflux permease
LLASTLGCISLLGLLILPLVVGGLVDELGFSERDAGLLSSASFLGAASVALALSFRIHHLDLRRLALIGLLGMAVGDGFSAAAAHLPVEAVIAARFLSGAASGALYGAVMASFAAHPRPDRSYGIFMALQFAVSGAALFLLPPLMPALGVTGVFTGFAGAAVLGLALLPSLSSGTRERAVDADTRSPVVSVEWRLILAPTALLCLLAYGSFEAAAMGQFAYIERIGVHLGLTPEQLGVSLGVASLVGIPGALAVTALGDRFGYFLPIAGVASAQLVVMLWLLRADGFAAYFVIACVYSIGWAFVLPYFQALCARIDPRGSVVVAGGFATGMAGFLGPAGAALLVRPGDYSLMIAGICAVLVFVIVVTFVVTRRLAMDKTRRV